MKDETRIRIRPYAVFLDNMCKPAETLELEFVKFKFHKNVNIVLLGRELILDQEDLIKILEFLKSN